MGKKIVIDAPKHPVVRFRWVDERHLELDLRGIRNPHSPFNGRLNPSKGYKRRWLTPEHLQCMVNEYFESCYGPMFDKWGNLVKDNEGKIVKVQVKPFTVSGLALYIGVSTTTVKKYSEGNVDNLLDEMKAETGDRITFSQVMSRARQTIEAYAEGRLYDRDGQRGAQYVLDGAFGWSTKKEDAEVDKLRADIKNRAEELEMKKKLLDDDGEDTNLTINIVRGRRGQDDE